MKVQLYSIEQAPSSVPMWPLLMDDLCNPPAKRVARVLGLSERTVRRYNPTSIAPRAVCLAAFWLTRWGRSAVDAATNDARLAVGYVDALRREVDQLREVIAHLQRTATSARPTNPQRLSQQHPGSRVRCLVEVYRPTTRSAERAAFGAARSTHRHLRQSQKTSEISIG